MSPTSTDPHLRLTPGRRLEHFDYFYREYDEFVFPMTIHPDVSGRPHVLLMHER